MRGAELYGDPDGDEDEEVLPDAWGGALRGGEHGERKKDKYGDCAQSREGCDARAEGVNEENKKNNYAEEPAGGRSGDGGDAIGDVARGEEQHYCKKKSEREECGYEGAAVRGAVQAEDCDNDENYDERGPQGERWEGAELARGGQKKV